MSLKIITGESIFYTTCEVIVNTTNCEGVMGKGLALSFFNKHRDICKEYNEYSKTEMNTNGLSLLDPKIYKLSIFEKSLCNYKSIMMFPTKISWRNSSKYEYIEKNLKIVPELLRTHKMESIAFPLLGCGNGGLDPKIVVEMIEQFSYNNLKLDIELYR